MRLNDHLTFNCQRDGESAFFSLVGQRGAVSLLMSNSAAGSLPGLTVHHRVPPYQDAEAYHSCQLLPGGVCFPDCGSIPVHESIGEAEIRAELERCYLLCFHPSRVKL